MVSPKGVHKKTCNYFEIIRKILTAFFLIYQALSLNHGSSVPNQKVILCHKLSMFHAFISYLTTLFMWKPIVCQGTILLNNNLELEIWLLGYFYRQSPIWRTPILQHNLNSWKVTWYSSVNFTVCFFFFSNSIFTNVYIIYINKLHHGNASVVLHLLPLSNLLILFSFFSLCDLYIHITFLMLAILLRSKSYFPPCYNALNTQIHSLLVMIFLRGDHIFWHTWSLALEE